MDVFISYSRRDKEFMRRLHAALIEIGQRTEQDIWVDFEDIPPTADWWKEIQAGIESSDNFIFLISPDSVRSLVCGDEVRHAITNNKRLIPILHREVLEAEDKEKLHPSISAHNWIFMREEDDFETALRSLLDALDTDLDHARAHTRLFIRAREWKAKNEDTSLLLRGADLTQAETWLAQSGGKEPIPTPLHSEFITLSRKAETRRQRFLLSGVSFALVVAVALAALSAVLFQQAERQRGIAHQNAERATFAQGEAEFQASTAVAAQETSVRNYILLQTQAVAAQNSESTAVYQSSVSEALALSAQAQLELSGSFPERGVSLAIASLENYPYTLAAEQTLGIAIDNSPGRAIVQAHTGVVSDARWSPDESRIVTAGWDHQVHIWEASTYELLMTLTGHTSAVQSAVWSPDGSRLLTAGNDGFLIVWDVQTGEEILRIRDSSGSLNSAEWSNDGSRILTAALDGYARVWRINDPAQPVLEIKAHDGSVWDAAWSPDGRMIVTGGNDGLVNLWDAQTGDLQMSLEGHSDAVWSVNMIRTDRGDRLVTTGNDNLTQVWNLGAPAPPDGRRPDLTLRAQQSTVFDAAWSADRRHLATVAADDTLRVWEAENGGEQLRLSVPSDQTRTGIRSIMWSQDSERVLTAHADGTYRIWDVSAADNDLLTIEGHAGIIIELAWSPDGTRLVTASGDSRAKIWDAATGEELVALSGRANGLTGAAWSPDGTLILTTSSDGTARVWNTSGETLFTIEGHGENTVNGAAWSPDGTRFVTGGGDNTARVWDTAAGEPLLTLEGHTNWVVSLAWSPDGTRIYTGGMDGLVKIWDAETGEELASWQAHDAEIQRIRLSPDGTHLATASWDGSGKIWDVHDVNGIDDRPEAMLGGHRGFVLDLAWSPNNLRLVSVGADGAAHLWDRTHGDWNELTGWGAHPKGVTSTSWSPDGTMLLTGGADGTAKVWRVWQTTEDLIVYARECCTLRELTEGERNQFGLDD